MNADRGTTASESLMNSCILGSTEENSPEDFKFWSCFDFTLYLTGHCWSQGHWEFAPLDAAD